MLRSVNTRVVGASLIGAALVVGAYFTNSLKAAMPDTGTVYAVGTEAPLRAPLSVHDSNDDGIEDWQEPFLTAAPVLLNTTTGDFARDNTVTEQVSIALMENLLASQGLGAGSLPKDVLVKQATAQVAAAAQDKIYAVVDITTLPNATDAQIRAYGNVAATIITDNNISGLRNEILILDDAMRTKDKKYFEQITQKAQMYATIRDELLTLPVPTTLRTEHLALINVTNALSSDLFAMVEIESDPLKSLLRIQRYQEDSAQLAFALQGIYLGLAKYPTLFTPEDAALGFSLFSSVQRRP